MGETQWLPTQGGYSYAYQLIEQIRELNQGRFLQRSGYETSEREPTDFCIGAAVYPEHPDSDERKEFAKIKFDSGAEYGITQMIFDPEIYGEFCSMLQSVNISVPILPGVRILRSKDQAEIMEKRFGCSVPGWYKKMLPQSHGKGEFSEDVVAPFIELVDRMKKLGAPGVHIFVLTDVELCQMSMAHLKERYK